MCWWDWGSSTLFNPFGQQNKTGPVSVSFMFEFVVCPNTSHFPNKVTHVPSRFARFRFYFFAFIILNTFYNNICSFFYKISPLILKKTAFWAEIIIFFRSCLQKLQVNEGACRLLENGIVCVEVLRPSQPNGVMSSAASLPNHTFTGQA